MAYLPDEHQYSDDGGHGIRDGEGAPDTFQPENGGKQVYERNHEYDLSCQGQENGFSGHAEALEEVGAYYLEADHPEGEGSYAQACYGSVNLLGVLHEQGGYVCGEQLRHNRADGSYREAGGGGQEQSAG